MRTKRLNRCSWPRHHELSSDAALRTTPYCTHGNRISASTTYSIYLTRDYRPVTNSGYMRARDYILHVPISFPGNRKRTGSAVLSAEKLGHGFGPCPDLEFFVDTADVGMD